jgi:hypothetical protein
MIVEEVAQPNLEFKWEFNETVLAPCKKEILNGEIPGLSPCRIERADVLSEDFQLICHRSALPNV